MEHKITISRFSFLTVISADKNLWKKKHFWNNRRLFWPVIPTVIFTDILRKNIFEKKHFENNRRLFWPVIPTVIFTDIWQKRILKKKHFENNRWWVIVGMSHSLYTNTAYNLTTSTKWLYSKFKKCKLNKTWNCHHHWMLKPPKSDHKQILLQLFNYLYSICLDFLIKY